MDMRAHHLPGTHHLDIQLSNSLHKALIKQCQESGHSVNHVIQSALAKALLIEHHTLYQVSTATALVQGVYQGCVTVGNLKAHGDFGLGTFDALDGEGLMMDGRIWQAHADGSVTEPPDTATAPFWVCTRFEADRTDTLASVQDWSDLTRQLDKLRGSENLFVAFRIRGHFDQITYRVACKTAAGTDLVTATSHQAEFEQDDVQGTLMGFWSPTYARTFNIPGYHLHLLTADLKHGGHVLGLRASNLKVDVMNVQNVMMALPESPQFLEADLSGDPSVALNKAEGASR
jgi:acetolactate decarboxylase